MQHLSTRRENIRPHCLFLQTVALCVTSFLISVAEAQNNSSSCDASQQPVVTAVNPPSGTVETTYNINGENLNETRSVLAIAGDNGDVLATAVQTANGYSVTLKGTAAGAEVTIIFVPAQDSCLNATVQLSVLRVISVILTDDPLVVQPGTIAATERACLPSDCGDNSTDYEVIANGHQLQKFSANRLGFVVRFPDTNVTFQPSYFSIQTSYSLLTSSDDRIMFRESPPITSVSPTMGQRGTRVMIEGENLEGYGEGTIDISRVVIGGSPANITFSNSTHVFARLNSGTPNSTSIGINTTQTISRLDRDVYDGPYTYSDDLWTQLEDGVVTELLPPAAQIGKLLTICGERLLGGGNIVTEMTIAGQTVVTFGEVGPNQNPGGPPKCINATVPDIPNAQGRVSGSILIEADTGALVESQNNIAFTYANIASVNPSQGQVGTEVTISGIELLSGYSDLEPTVYLSDVEATVSSASGDTVIVRVEDPGPSGSGNFLLPNTTGDVVVTVTQNGQEYTVSMSDGWTYLEAGIIEQVEPGFGQIGTRITITGTNLLGYGSTLDQALIGNATATIISYSDTVVVLDAPDVSVLRSVDIVLVSDNGARVSRDQAFEYRERGIISSLNPPSGQIGTIVVISGSNLFGHADNVSRVTFGEIEAEIDYTQATDTQITVRIQSNDVASNTAVPVVITGSTMARVSSSGNDWTYLVPGSIENVQPNIGQNGTMVSITGTNLLGGGNSVQSIFLDGVPGAVNTATSTLITVTMEDLSDQIDSYRNTVRIVANTGAIITGGTYNHQASGMITNIDPRTGREGTRVNITGNNLSGYGERVDQVLIAGVEATIMSQKSGSVVVGVGAASAGTQGTVVLISNTGAYVSSSDSLVFTYTAQGIISNVSPSEGAEGSGILIEGVSLRPVGTVIITVTIGGSPVSRIVTESESEVSVIAGPAPETGDYNMPIVITASDGSIVRGGNFSYLNLTLSLPNIDQGQLGTEVRISLPDDDAFIASLPLVVRIGGQEADIIATSDSNRILDVAAPRAGEVGTYTADVTVEGIDGRVARLRNGFRYIEEGVVFGVNPTTGQQGTRITLSGRNLLGGGSNISTARIGDRNGPETDAIVTNSNDNLVVIEITNNLPAGSTYPLLSDITLVADTGATVISLRQFTLVQPGQITSVSPAQGQFGTRVTISGSNLLQGGSREDIFSITLSGIEILEILDTPSPPSDAQITVRANTSSAGDPGEVIITLMSGARIVSPGSVTFQYLSPGRIVTVEPNIGTVGTNVVISGENLLGGGSLLEITLGGTRANIAGTPSDARIEVRAGDPSGDNANGTVEIVIDTGAIISGGVWSFEDLGIITSISPTVGQQGVAVTAAGRSLLGSSASSFTSCTLAGITGMVTQSENDGAICRAGFNPFAGINPDDTRLSGPLVLTADSGPIITSTEMFRYYIAYIEMIEPTNGTNGTYVTITGKNLIYNDLMVASVTFGGISTLLGTTRVLTDDSIRVRVGVSPATSSVDVRLQLTNEAFFVLENAWAYTEPGVITSISPQAALPGEEVYIYGTNLVPADVDEVMVVVGQTRSYEAFVNGSSVIFRPGPTQDGINVDTDLDIPNFDLPIRVIASNGATVYNRSVVFQYMVSSSRVDAVVPTAGVGGTGVTITGTNLLSGSSSAVRVTLAGRNATILNATDSLVRVIAGEGPYEGSRGRVIIEGANGQVSGIGRDVWEYFPEITADDVFPQMGQNRTSVSIDLKGISLTPSEVYLADIRATIVDFREGRLRVAAGPSQATSVGDITIKFIEDEESAELTISSAWQYLNPISVSSLTPEQGYFNTNVTIQGTNFQVGGRSVQSVQLAGLNTELISQSNTEIVVRVSELRDSSTSAIVGPVTIYSDDGATHWSSVEFTYVQLRVDEVTPQTGQGGTVVTITGVGLLAGSSLPFLQFQLGGVDLQSNLTITNTEIQVAAAPYPAETNESDITYTVADGGTVTIPDSWSYVQPGQITSVDPSYGVQGSYVTIRGENMLQGGMTVANVMIAGIPVMEIVVGISDFIHIRLGLSPTTPQGTVKIESNTGASLESDIEFVYNASGRVSTISLSEGQNGTRVTINGMGFATFGAVSRVTLAGVEATLVGEVTDTAITVEAGRPDIFEEFNGGVIIEAVTGAIITGSPVFRYRQEGVIYRAYPPQGQMQTRVIISGESLFGGGSSLETVFLAGIEAEINENESNDSFVSVTAAASERAPLVGDIILISDTGAYVRKTDGWSYVEPGNITSIEPAVGQFGTRITIRGIDLLSGGNSISSVVIGDIVSYDVLSSSDTEVVARAGRPNTTDNFTETVTLVSNFGGELASSFSWTYLNSSAVTSVSPMIGVGGDEVTVNGTSLLGGGTDIFRVTTAGIAAIDVDGSDDQIVFKVGPEPNGAAIQGDIVIESNTGALTIVEGGWSYNRTCPEGAFGTVVDNCTSCDEECTACTGPTDEDCLTCANFIIPLSESSMRCVNKCPNVSTLANVCVDLCESNQFRQVNTILNATFCHDCHPLCDAQLGCTGPNATQCNGCEVALDVNTQACVSVCPSGTWQNEMKECIPCDDQCLSSAGCFGDTKADCYECRNVRAPSILLENESTNNSERYICLERCPPDSYEDNGDCFPCDRECEGGCTGPTPFDCNRCASVSRIQASNTLCVSSCNANLLVNNLYQYSNGTCQACSELCSLVDGCTGPNDSDCVTCRTNASTNATLPRFNGTCVLVCPNTSASVSPKPSQFYYHNMVTGSCELCDSSCTNGCRGSSVDDCIDLDEESTSPFAAGVATIGITASIIVILAILCAVLFLMSLWCWVKNSRHNNKYRLDSSAEATEPANNEMVYRYTRSDPKESTPTQIQETVNAGLEAEYYTPMSPTTPLAPQLRSQSPQHAPTVVQVEEKYKDVRRSAAIDSGVTMIENVEAALYTEAGPEVPQIPARPAKPVQEKTTGMQKSSLDRRGKPPGKQVKKPAAAPPPEPEGEVYTEMSVQPPEGEFYTEMNASVQEVYVHPTQDEEYSEMSPLHIIQEQVYDDTAGPTDNLLPPQSEALYEDTDTTVTSPSYQKIKQSNSAQPLPSTRAPDLPVSQKRRSVPLPQTPLEVSIQGRQPKPVVEEVYEFAESSLPEESLYEAIPTSQAGRPLPAEPSPQLPPKGLRTSGRYPPIPPRDKQ